MDDFISTWNPKQPILSGCFGKTSIFHVKVWFIIQWNNHLRLVVLWGVFGISRLVDTSRKISLKIPPTHSTFPSSSSRYVSIPQPQMAGHEETPRMEVTYLWGPVWRSRFNEEPARWAPTSYKWSYNLYKWPYKWVTGVITLLMGVITPFITDRGRTLCLFLAVYGADSHNL